MQHNQHAAVQSVYEDLAEQLDLPAGSGNKLSPDDWHHVMMHAFSKEMGWDPKLLPSIDGHGTVLAVRPRQSRLTKKQGSDLIEFAKAYGAARGATIREWNEFGEPVE